MADKKSKGYRDTLNLPKTSFSMKANLVQREPGIRKVWAKEGIYNQIRQVRKGSPVYTLHDGPPYANGDIHMGHVVNKLLKDFVVKYKTMAGFDAPYVPGWDCHGLPIEAKVVAEMGEKMRGKSKLEIRGECKKYASKYIKVQSKQFEQLGIFGDFANPYLTFVPAYEAGILEVFAELVDKGLVYKQLKPIHWSIECETALAEAELEYKDISSPSIFVNLYLEDKAIRKLRGFGLVQPEDERVCLMIWTTTPWTLAANLAVAVHPELDYVILRYEKDGTNFVSLVAAERVQAVVEAGGLTKGQYEVGKKLIKGKYLEHLRYDHPFVDRNPTEKDAWMVICAEYVTTADGTGLVHIAPGHGLEDYISGQKCGLAVYSPVKNDGCYDDTVPEWLRGRNVLEVDHVVNKDLRDKGLLFAEDELVHSYPHCWRSKGPVIFRATEQWFISVDKELPGVGKSMRDLALERIREVRWIPAWGENRIAGMLESRPDWCISRQRSWGLPIPVFVNSRGESLLTKESVLAVGKHVGQTGSNSWFTDSPQEILGEDFSLPDGFDFDDLQKEENIFDVWFESGCSWYSAASKKDGWSVPVDLYLEGSDQHRGWFQLSLLPALAATGAEPFKGVLTHGFVVDERGLKQSKSLGNYVNAQQEIGRYGSDIVRLWVSSVNYQEDIRCNDELIRRTQDAYRKVRNTLRYLLGNTDDFDPGQHAVAYEEMFEIDRWAVGQLEKLIVEVTEAYDNFVFHRVFSLLYNFCTVQMSSIYMDVLKDRLYCDAADSPSRRSAQTAMHMILDSLVRMLAPVLAHTAEEAWSAMKFKSQDVASVHMALMPKIDDVTAWAKAHPAQWQGSEARWTTLMNLRDEVLRVLEGLRRNQKIGSNQEASVTVCSDDEELVGLLGEFGLDHFAGLCIVSEVRLQRASGETSVAAEKSSHQKCQRCWNYWSSVGASSKCPDLCARCMEVVNVSVRE
jgi:isoleucyl-tRNA synthetase